MQVSAISCYQSDLKNNCRKPCFNGKVNSAIAQKAKAVRNYIFAGIASGALLCGTSCVRNAEQKRMEQVQEYIYSQPKIDSAAWAAFEKWDEEHTPYWDKPGYDGPIYEKDFLEWQDSVNSWWDNYFKAQGKK